MIARYIVLVLCFIILDLMWFTFSGSMYGATVANIQGSQLSMNVPAAIVSWMLLGFGVSMFVDGSDGSNSSDGSNGSTNTNKLRARMLKGAALGACVYGVYNATNMAIFKDYDYKTALADTTWGIFVTGAVSAIGPEIARMII
mgnify:CR=1 FL=1